MPGVRKIQGTHYWRTLDGRQRQEEQERRSDSGVDCASERERMKTLIEKCGRTLCVVLTLLLIMSALTLATGAAEAVSETAEIISTSEGWRIVGYDINEPMGEAERRHFLRKGEFITETGTLYRALWALIALYFRFPLWEQKHLKRCTVNTTLI